MNGDVAGSAGRNKEIDHISKLNEQKQKWKKSAVVCLSSADQSDDSDLDDRNDRKRWMLRDTSLGQKNSLELNDSTLQQRQPDAATSSSSLFDEKDVIQDISLDASSCCDDSTFLDSKQNVHHLQQRYDSSIAELRQINQRQIRIEDYDFFEKYVKVVERTIISFQLGDAVPTHAEHVLVGISKEKRVLFESPLLQLDERRSFEYTTTESGEITVSCRIYPDMECKIVVLSGTAPPPAPTTPKMGSSPASSPLKAESVANIRSPSSLQKLRPLRGAFPLLTKHDEVDPESSRSESLNESPTTSRTSPSSTSSSGIITTLLTSLSSSTSITNIVIIRSYFLHTSLILIVFTVILSLTTIVITIVNIIIRSTRRSIYDDRLSFIPCGWYWN